MRQTVMLIAVLITSHLFAMWLGSSLQLRSQEANSHAHLSDVGDAIILGNFFARTGPASDDPTIPARAAAGIIYRILKSSNPGPNSRVRLEHLEAELRLKYSDASRYPL